MIGISNESKNILSSSLSKINSYAFKSLILIPFWTLPVILVAAANKTLPTVCLFNVPGDEKR